MTATDAISVEVPDIGDFEDVPVIEIHVAPGDSVAVEDPLLTLESDKATMDVPAPFAGTVRELRVAVGDRVSQGTPLLTMESADGAETGTTASAAASEGAPAEARLPVRSRAPPPTAPASGWRCRRGRRCSSRNLARLNASSARASSASPGRTWPATG